MTAIVLRTLLVSGLATLLAVLVGVPAGYVIARRSFRGRTLLLGMVNTGMGMPPVVVGLIVWVLLVRSGPFGDLGLIYTQVAMVIAQILIATPIVIGFIVAKTGSFLSHELNIASRVRATRQRRDLTYVKPACPRRCITARW